MLQRLRTISHGILLSGLSYSALAAQPTLRQIDSVVIRERDDAMLSKPGSMQLGPRGFAYVVDAAESRIFQIAPNGTITSTFGRKGSGPGELMAPGALAFLGDSMFVLDRSQRRISVYELRSRKFVRSFGVAVGNFAEIAWSGAELLATTIDAATMTPVTVLSPAGAVVRREGVIPDIVHKNAMLASVGMQQPVATRGDDRWGATDFSQSIFRWKRGSTEVAEELKLPVFKRRGVSAELFLQLLRDPSKDPAQIYNHSTPIALAFVARDVMALISFDPTFSKGAFTGPHYLTLIDVQSRKVCGDYLLPIPPEPQPRVAMSGDTVAVLHQVADRNGEIVTSLLRFRIDARPCKWVALQ